ncbi:MAG: hypothetical protein IKQ68_02950 [Prevotella sp.]|nr:hypothetical protein [Prevotella sp.]
MDKKIYLMPSARFVRIRVPRILAGSLDKDPNEPITSSDEIGAKGTGFGLWEDSEE